MPEIYIRWYDQYGCSCDSAVYFVDSIRDRFLVVDENKNFHWVFTDECELVKETKHWA